MTTIASQITSITAVYSTVYSDADQRKHQSFASLAFVWGSHRDRWIPRTKGQLRGKCFHLMTSSWKCHEGLPRDSGSAPTYLLHGHTCIMSWHRCLLSKVHYDCHDCRRILIIASRHKLNLLLFCSRRCHGTPWVQAFSIYRGKQILSMKLYVP